jgi:hypothetical protein
MVSNLGAAKRAMQDALVIARTGATVTDAKRVDYSPVPMMLFKSDSKLVLKNKSTPTQHLTVGWGGNSLEVHRTDELRKSTGGQWWESLGAMTLADIPVNSERARKAFAAMWSQMCQVIPVCDPAEFGFFISPKSPAPGKGSTLPLQGTARMATVDMGSMIDGLRIELVDSFDFGRARLCTGCYLWHSCGSIAMSEQGLLSFYTDEGQRTPVAFAFTTMRDYLSMMNQVLCRLLGLRDDIQIVPPIPDAQAARDPMETDADSDVQCGMDFPTDILTGSVTRKKGTDPCGSAARPSPLTVSDGSRLTADG